MAELSAKIPVRMRLHKPKISRKSYLRLEVSVAGRPSTFHDVYLDQDIQMNVEYSHTEVGCSTSNSIR